mmetsp:Transcript_10186/g.30646  ORF Transcript_10186/g.30646 Transcript_10186/m.30646 type:complete len:209 (+) Transcript_10186:1584-2210(+)
MPSSWGPVASGGRCPHCRQLCGWRPLPQKRLRRWAAMRRQRSRSWPSRTWRPAPAPPGIPAWRVCLTPLRCSSCGWAASTTAGSWGSRPCGGGGAMCMVTSVWLSSASTGLAMRRHQCAYPISFAPALVNSTSTLHHMGATLCLGAMATAQPRQRRTGSWCARTSSNFVPPLRRRRASCGMPPWTQRCSRAGSGGRPRQRRLSQPGLC